MSLAKPGKLSGHETYPIWASSESERSDWMSALRRAIYSDVGGGKYIYHMCIIFWLCYGHKIFAIIQRSSKQLDYY